MTSGYDEDDQEGLMPEGEYPARVVDAYYAETKSGNQKVVVELDVYVDGGRKAMKAHLPTEGFVQKINNYIESLRRPGDPVEVPPGKYAKRACRVVIKHRKGKTKTFANVDSFLPEAGGHARDETKRAVRADAGERNPF